MNLLVTRLMKGTLGAVSAAVLVGLVAAPGQAQSAARDLVTPSQNENRDLFSERNENPMNGIHDLIHQLNYGSIRSSEEFRQEQQRNINSAAEEFRTRQRAILEQQQQQSQPAEAQPAAGETVAP